MTESISVPRAVLSALTDTADTIRLTDLNAPEIVDDYRTVTYEPKRFTQWGRVTFIRSEGLATGAIGISEDRQYYLDLLRVQETEGNTQISFQRVNDVRPLVHLFERERIGGRPSPSHDRTLRHYRFAPVSTECINVQGQMQEHPHAIPLKSHDGPDLGRLHFYSPSDDSIYLANGQVVLRGARVDESAGETSPRYSIVVNSKQL